MAVPIVYNIRNLIERKGTTLMTALGIGLTVAVLVTAMALQSGLATVFAGSGNPLQVLVMRKGVDSELNSTVTDETCQIVRRLPGVARTPKGDSMVSPEGITVVNLPSTEHPDGMNVTVRGMLPIGMQMRTLQIVQGTTLQWGQRQVIVGQSIARRYPDAQIGKTIRFGKGLWTVVGIFKAGDSAANSEIWADLDQVRGDFESQGGSNSLLVRVQNDSVIPALTSLIDGDQRLSAAVTPEIKYYANMTKSGLPLQVLGFSVAVIMAVGSAFAATNTMYAAVSRRTREIATMRAIGFGRWAILQSFMLESICLALLGGLVGVLIALPVNGMGSGIGNFSTFSEIEFEFHITLISVGYALAFAALIGALGGLLPAWSASRKSIVAAMRD